MSFSKIAPVYNRFNDNSIYEDWLDFTLSQLDSKPKIALDIACGTGQFTNLLAPFVNHLDAIDIDEAMLNEALKESYCENITYFKADMLDLSKLPNEYDLVTCYADSLCFLNNFEQFELAAKQAYLRLRSEGLYLFDVWSLYQVIEGFDGFSYAESDDESSLIWESYVDCEQSMVTHELTVFQKQAQSDLFEKIICNLSERTYPVQQYYEMLKRVGFSNIKVFIDFGEYELETIEELETDRWFFVCSK